MNLAIQLIDLLKQQIAWQMDTYNSLETKTIGLLAFDGAFSAFVALIYPQGFVFRLLFFGFLAVSVAACVMSLAVRKVFVGPQARPFYEITITQSDEDALLSLLTTLSDDFDRNNRPIARKGLYWTIAGYALVGAVLCLGVRFIV